MKEIEVMNAPATTSRPSLPSNARVVDQLHSSRGGDTVPSRGIRVVAFPKNSRQNPHMRLLYSALAVHGIEVVEGTLKALAMSRYDVVHYHWPERLLNRSLFRQWRGFARFVLEMTLIRMHRGRVVWTVQNIKGHEEGTGLLPRLFRRVFFSRLAGFISLSQTAHQLVLQTYPTLRDKKSIVAPRGHYRDLYPTPPARSAARLALHLPPDNLVIGMVGLIRPYKNTPHLLRSFRSIPRADLTLLVAGECTNPALQAELEQLARGDSRVRLAFRFVPEAELPVLIRALDLVVLPYTEILNSGSALLSLSLDVPVLAPAMGTLIEVQRAVGTNWVRTYSGALDSQVLSESISWAAKHREDTAPLSFFDWTQNAGITAAFFRELLHAS
jgi:beta-1,4-mannosyltransferase